MAGYYDTPDRGFQLFASAGSPAWRDPQVAALGAVLAQWSLVGGEHPLVSVPTGVGKTAIALAAPFIANAKRTLVVVPTQELRRQTVEHFRTQEVLRRIGALRSSDDFVGPDVHEAVGRAGGWSSYETADVVVGIPASVSPAHLVDDPPPPDLFDLLVVDEAHHAPATTWMVILEHFSARALLLTATPHRRDRKRLPGKLVYYYPLRQALEQGLYQPIDPTILDVPEGADQSALDRLIATEVVNVLGRPEHESSQFLIRSSTKARATELASLYRDLGHEIPVLHSGLSDARQRSIIEGLRSGRHRGVAMVGMLVEGFDLPSLRVAGYHDKHKSLEPTAQLIGRLARVNEKHPQRSVLVTARDIDIYPQLEGALRSLYEEDRDWAAVLPGIIDAFVEDDLKNTEYARSFDGSSGEVDLAHLHPLRRARIFEIDPSLGWTPMFGDGKLPESLTVGERFAGQRILYAGTNPDHSTLLIVTGARTRPRWNSGDQLDSVEYDLHVVSFRQPARVDRSDLLLVNTVRVAAQKQLLEAIGADKVATPGDPGRIQVAFDSLERISVSSVGVRNTYGAMQGSPSYKMFAGKAIESGLRDSDTAHTSLGHAMVQVNSEAGSFTAGVSTGKSKYWETRYTPLRLYESFVAELAERYWYPPASPSGPLLPQINRGQTLVSWPASDVLAVTMDYALIGAEWTIDGLGPLDSLDLHSGQAAVILGAPSPATGDRMPLAATMSSPSGDTLVWTGELDLLGNVTPTEDEVAARRGHSNPTALSALLTERPPTLFFLNGVTVRGRELFPPTSSSTSVPSGLVLAQSWNGVDIQAETRSRAAKNGLGQSVHEWLETYLSAQPRRGKHRWILSNDGSGEIADYVVIETLPTGQVAVDLWHAKFAGGASPSVRIGDFEVVSAQAIKSRRWPTDRRLWTHLGARLQGREHPPAVLVEGRVRQLEVLLGLVPRWDRMSIARRQASVVGRIGIVQPGLSLARLEDDLAAGRTSAVQITQLLTVFSDAVVQVASPVVLAAP